MIFHETNKFFLIKYFAFVKLQCNLLTFTFNISDFKCQPHNFGSIRTDSKF
jgi:hypothetical protein